MQVNVNKTKLNEFHIEKWTIKEISNLTNLSETKQMFSFCICLVIIPLKICSSGQQHKVLIKYLVWNKDAATFDGTKFLQCLILLQDHHIYELSDLFPSCFYNIYEGNCEQQFVSSHFQLKGGLSIFGLPLWP